jgi:Putative prokaryotic signal transducing protein
MAPQRDGVDDRAGGDELVGLIYANDQVEAEMIQGLLKDGGIPSLLQPVGINGPQVGIGWLNPGGGSRRVMVHANRLEEARALLAETLVEDEGGEWPETANARYLEEDRGHKPRDYGLVGAYARSWFWSLGAMAVAFGVFLLLRTV